MANKIDSNVTGLAISEEATLKTLPGSPVWYELEPNSYSDLGGELSNVARNPINPSRQRKKGKIVDLDASGGFNTDITLNNMQRLLQGFFFADAREKYSTQLLNGTAIAISAVDGTTEDYEAASGLDSFLAGHLVFASGFGVSANNGLKTVSAAASGALTVDQDLVDEATPPSTAKVQVCGYECASGDINITASASSIVLSSTVLDFTTLGLTPGEWIFVGGDAASNRFVSNEPGYARIASISANSLALDDTTWTPITETGTGLEIRLFFGLVIRNEKTPSLIKRRSYNVERQLGQDANGTQSEYLEGAIPNEFTLNIPQADKLNADLSFVAMDNTQRTGTDGLKAGSRVSAVSEDAFNTSSDIYRIKLNVVDPTTLNPNALFGYVSEATIAINNNVTANKAVAVLGAFDATAGDFEVSGSITAYFTEVSAVQAVRRNSDVALNFIAAQNNSGFVYDIPLIALSGGRLNVEKDAPITIPVEASAAECEAGYTMMCVFFPYLPSVGMPA